jgi:hypothetical protein
VWPTRPITSPTRTSWPVLTDTEPGVRYSKTAKTPPPCRITWLPATGWNPLRAGSTRRCASPRARPRAPGGPARAPAPRPRPPPPGRRRRHRRPGLSRSSRVCARRAGGCAGCRPGGGGGPWMVGPDEVERVALAEQLGAVARGLVRGSSHRDPLAPERKRPPEWTPCPSPPPEGASATRMPERSYRAVIFRSRVSRDQPGARRDDPPRRSPIAAGCTTSIRLRSDACGALACLAR